MATATGKRARAMTGLNRYQLHKSSHTKKSPEKIKRMGWTRDKKKKQS